MSAPVAYLPRKDALLATWAANFNGLIAAGYASYGLTSAQATAFATLKNNFASALATSSNPSTRTVATVAAKTTAKSLLLAAIRGYAAICHGYPAITPTQLADLGLTVRKTTPTPVPAPGTKPIITIAGTGSQNVMIRFADETTPTARKRPLGVIGMALYAHVGNTPPAGPAAADFRALLTVNTTGPGTRAATVNFTSDDVGKTAYLFGRWFNRRGQSGPWSSVAQSTIAA